MELLFITKGPFKNYVTRAGGFLLADVKNSVSQSEEARVCEIPEQLPSNAIIYQTCQIFGY